MGGEMKDKVKDFMKKVNNPFSSSSSGKFKGQGRVLGSSSSSSSTEPPPPLRGTSNNSHYINTSRPQIKPVSSDAVSKGSSFGQRPVQNMKVSNGFDPYDSFVTSTKKALNLEEQPLFNCPMCNKSYRTEDEVSVHIDTCVADDVSDGGGVPPINEEESMSELEVVVGNYVSGKPYIGSVEVVLRLLKNIGKEPDNAKFRRIRMSNPKIREAIGEVAGGVELLECVGFKLREEDGEMWAVMNVPNEEGIGSISKVVSLLERCVNVPSGSSVTKHEVAKPIQPKKVDRQIRVFFSVAESVAARIEVPDSFYKLSPEEVKREAIARKKKLEESQLLVPKSFKEKQAKAARKQYTRTVIRIQFPDGVVLQGVFGPWEPTGALYEFVSSALKEPSLEFELIHPVVIKRRVIPHSPAPGERFKTLDDEELVPSALIKFKPLESDSVVFTGLCNELLEISEPLPQIVDISIDKESHDVMRYTRD